MPAYRVLIVDDEPVFLKLVKRFLTLEGFEPEVTESGTEALSLLERLPFDLLLSDIQMPGLSGLDVIRHAKLLRPDILVILMTGYGSVPSVMAATREGAAGYILKPFTQQGLHAVVRKALEKDRLLRENVRMKSLMSLAQFSRMLMLSDDLDALMAHIVEWIRQETRTDHVSLMLRDEKSGALSQAAAAGRVENSSNGLHRAEGIARMALDRKETVLIQGEAAQSAYSDTLVSPSKTASLLTLPLCLREKAVGVIQIYSRTHPLSESDTELVAIFCRQAAIAIENVHLYQSAKTSYLHTLQALVAAIEVKDPCSKGHAAEVERYARLMADRLPLTRAQKHDLSLAATLHDIGHISSQDNIMEKTGPLSPDEFEQIKSHCANAVGILQPIRLSPEIGRGILHHHERWDGGGYPHRLAGEEIPLYSRIIAIADAMDTMTQPHPYRQPVTHAEAREELSRHAGKQFDPHLVEIFLALNCINK